MTARVRQGTPGGFARMVLAASLAGAAAYYALFQLARWAWQALPPTLHG